MTKTFAYSNSNDVWTAPKKNWVDFTRTEVKFFIINAVTDWQWFLEFDDEKTEKIVKAMCEKWNNANTEAEPVDFTFWRLYALKD